MSSDERAVLDTAPYRGKCHVDGCPTRFIGISRKEYIRHLRTEHGELKAGIWETLVIDDA